MVTYINDGLGRERSASSAGTNYASNINYHPSSVVSSMTYGNGHVYTQTLNNRLLPQRLRAQKSGTVALNITYTYDARGDITSMFDATDSNNYRTYGYDALNRLTTANGPWGTGNFTYDALGNMRYKTLSSRQVNINYDSRNRATQSTDTAGSTRNIGYDSRGNVTSLGGLSFTYDYSDQPTSLSGSSKGTYKYDGNMKRVKATVNGKTIYNVYDSSGSLVHVDNSKAIVIPYNDLVIPAVVSNATDYINVAGMTIARLNKNTPTYLHPNHLGSAVAGTSATGAIAWKEQYTPFGEKRIANAANDNQGSFTGHIDDSATGLTYMQARYYDPVIGRFLSIDPVGFVETNDPRFFNRYVYTFNNPTNLTDPDGECPQCVSGAIGGLIGGVVGGVSSFASSGGSLKAAAIGAAGGAVSGAVIGSTGQITAGLAAGSATSSLLNQATENGGFDLGNVSIGETAVDVAVGVTVGKVIGTVKVPGITSGRNSFGAIAKSNTTKLRNGTISSISAKSAGKAVLAGAIGGAGQTLISAGADSVKEIAANVIGDEP